MLFKVISASIKIIIIFLLIETLHFYNIYLMNLREFIFQFPRNKRTQVRKIIAKALNVSESAIKTWELGLRNPKPKYIAAINLLTDGKVGLSELINKD